MKTWETKQDCEGGEICEFFFDYFFYFDWGTIALLSLATFIIFLGSSIHMLNNKNAAIKTLTMIIGVGAVFSISYFILSSNEILDNWKTLNSVPDEQTSQFVGMGLWSFYILLSLAAISIVATELLQKFKN